MQRPGAADDALSDEGIAAILLAQVAARGAGRSICPSEVARALTPDWRPLMDRVRQVARGLARDGRVLITQRGVVRDPDAVLRGPWRLAQPPEGGRSGST
ncbi:DUF3253 domain-containing protein [Methyloversatilis universalis]|uniref:DUF3253 domain-containing protein n=1 Tax=Methyloversatilis universalis TaxID=378211 RepID=UPI00036C23C3|nr:DUF3253 domain-containing protein [Methyloversatilis universalis]